MQLNNNEIIYYRHLAKVERNFFKRSYYIIESRLLNQYQKTLPAFLSYAALSQNDVILFKQKYDLQNVFFIPCFLPWQEVSSLNGTGSYCLYHGNLAVAENEAAAQWLIEKVFSQFDMPFIIPGKNIPQNLVDLGRQFQKIRF